MLMDSLVGAFCAGPVDHARVKKALLLFMKARVSQGVIRAAALEEGKQYIRDCSVALNMASKEMAKEIASGAQG